MIISLNILCGEHVQHMFRNYPKVTYGLAMPYAKDCAYSGILSQGEDLFISAHGSPVSIGHQEGEPRFTADQLARWLEESVLPCNYWGNLYLAAPGAGPSYLQALLEALGAVFMGRIHGQFDLAYGQLSSPIADVWVKTA